MLLKKRARDELLDIQLHLPTYKPIDRIFKIAINIKNQPQEKPIKLYRNPVFYALELKDIMKKEGITQAQLSRKMGISRARVTQILNVLKLPTKSIDKYKCYGNSFTKRIITERQLRNN